VFGPFQHGLLNLKCCSFSNTINLARADLVEVGYLSFGYVSRVFGLLNRLELLPLHSVISVPQVGGIGQADAAKWKVP
jgi:hypothetical protein